MHRLLPLLVLLAACHRGDDSDDTLPMQFELTPLVTLGDADGPGMLAKRPAAIRLHDGRWLAVESQGAPVVAVFSLEGRFLRTIGRAGEGPGEFSDGLATPVLMGDSVLFQPQSRRASLFGPDLTFVRSFALPASAYQIQPAGNGFVMTPATARAGPFLMRLDSEGNELRRYGPVGDARGAIPVPWTSVGPDGATWSCTAIRDLVVEQYDSLGAVTRTLRPVLAWAPVYQGYQRPTPTQSPGWMIRGFWQDSSGALILVVKIADAHWASGLGTPVPGEAGEMGYTIEDEDKVYDTLLQALDPVTGAVLASRRLDRAFRFSPFPGAVDRVIVDDENVRLEITGIALRPNPKVSAATP